MNIKKAISYCVALLVVFIIRLFIVNSNAEYTVENNLHWMFEKESVVMPTNNNGVQLKAKLHNKSDKAITIIGIKTNCSCVRSSFDPGARVRVLPGNSLTVTFYLGSQFSESQLQAFAILDSGVVLSPATCLIIKGGLKIEPRMLCWNEPEDGMHVKSTTISYGRQNIFIESVEVLGNNFEIVRQEARGDSLMLFIRPNKKDTEIARSGFLIINTLEDNAHKTQYVLLNIKNHKNL